MILTSVLIVNLVDLRTHWTKQGLLQEIAESLEPPETDRETPQRPYSDPPSRQDAPVISYASPFDAEMLDINPDYVCWVKIEGTNVDYPVVRADDNEKYLNTSFFGERSGLGALFMDYRCAGENLPHIIIYGHNARNGALFGGLRRFLSERYLKEHPTVTLRVNDRIVRYEIFSARETTVADPAYDLDFDAANSFDAFAERCGAPDGTVQILTLSTCVSAGNNNARVILQGALVDYGETGERDIGPQRVE